MSRSEELDKNRDLIKRETKVTEASTVQVEKDQKEDEKSISLDAMSEEDKQKKILSVLGLSDWIRLDNVYSMEFWQRAVQTLEDEGKVKTRFVDMEEEQYSFFEVRLAN